ncbi:MULTISPECIES: twin-arginine translocase subunit TatC [Streptomyces]|uniref:Sec-independent protein translocase protein TatC n=1 Tax=Streptomyces dengpaensis TaxID=2049881 RepID=A0ABM6T1L6_9ACTN|nr:MULTISPECIES: twin-arginine translocase subunit TatC [Streptomyces]AVH60791.1 twin-arginine translocase subunit TatC [Streptomyces dengpaensis]PIB03986.1 twin arginine-targeting protein translocase TatC [Streptomyces sp. HG99]
MPLAGHLRELRNRLVKAIGAVIVTTVVAGLFYMPLIDFVIAPLPGCVPLADGGTAGSGRCGVIATNGLLSPVTLALKVSLTAGLIGASPVWLYQLWRFLAPGLHRGEKSYTLAFLATGIPLFLAGAAFAYAVLPTTARVLISFTPHQATNILPVDDFLDLATRMVVVFGVSFELPLLLVMLNLAGVLTARRMASWWRHMVLGITAFAAIATPSGDPLSMLALAGPITALYLAACALSWANDRRRARKNAAGTGLGPDEPSPLPTHHESNHRC